MDFLSVLLGECELKSGEFAYPDLEACHQWVAFRECEKTRIFSRIGLVARLFCEDGVLKFEKTFGDCYPVVGTKFVHIVDYRVTQLVTP